MKRSERMGVMVKLIERQEQQAARALGFAQTHLEQERNKLAELKDYLRAYEGEMTTKGSAGISGAQWQNYQYFIGQLEQLIRQQHGVIQQAQRQVVDMQQKWHQVHQKRKTMDSFVESIRFDEWLVSEKKEQKEMDDLVLQMRRQVHSQ